MCSSISLVIIRLEILENQTLLSNLNFTIDGLCSFPLTKSYSEAVSNECSADYSSEKLAKIRGSRSPSSLIIESFYFTENPHKKFEMSHSSDLSKKAAKKQPNKLRTSEEKLLVSNESQLGATCAVDESQLGATCVTDTELTLDSCENISLQNSTDSLSFFSGNPSVETTEGVIHLYKNNMKTPLSEDTQRSEMICLLSVPASMSSRDILDFLAPVHHDWIEHIRVIRDRTPNQYMILIKFKTQKYADEFYKNFNNKPFNSIENNLCVLVYVAKLETIHESQCGPLPLTGITELPTCPVCLERMEESVDGILTILCNHSFHSSCLAKWVDSTCPVCRYMQTPEAAPDNNCIDCGSKESLWICLICGYVGCGRYVAGHAYSHFQSTQHTYSMQIGSSRVWDYAGDNYVHRIIQNKGDGKLVELHDESGRQIQDEKLDSITLEYTYLLTSQLESQREYYEEIIRKIEQEKSREIEIFRNSQEKYPSNEITDNEKKFLKEKNLMSKKISELTSKLKTLKSELSEENELNKSLLNNQKEWQVKIEQMEAEINLLLKEKNEMKDTMRDMMLNMEAAYVLSSSEKISKNEVEGCSVGLSSKKEKNYRSKKK